MELQYLQPLAQQLFADIRALTFDGVGVTRASYGAGENACARHLEAFARAEGLEVTTDRAGNFIYSDPADTRQGLHQPKEGVVHGLRDVVDLARRHPPDLPGKHRGRLGLMTCPPHPGDTT